MRVVIVREFRHLKVWVIDLRRVQPFVDFQLVLEVVRYLNCLHVHGRQALKRKLQSEPSSVDLVDQHLRFNVRSMSFEHLRQLSVGDLLFFPRLF